MRTTLIVVGAAWAGLALLPRGAAAQPPAGDVEACFLAGATLAEAAERPSPLKTIGITMGDQVATLCYGAPSARGRTIMGDLVPYGEEWRMGANEATAIHMPFGGTIGSVEVEPGSYSLFAVPAADGEWEIVVNRSVERWGIPIDADVRAHDVGSFTTTVKPTTSFTETLDYFWQSHGMGMGHLVMRWEQTQIEISIHLPGVGHGSMGSY